MNNIKMTVSHNIYYVNFFFADHRGILGGLDGTGRPFIIRTLGQGIRTLQQLAEEPYNALEMIDRLLLINFPDPRGVH